MSLRILLLSASVLLLSACVLRADERFERGVVGKIVAVETTRSPATITILFEETQTKLNLDLAKNARVTVAFEDAALTDLKPGAFAALQLGDDHRTVQAIHAQGEIVEVTIRTIDTAKNILTASLEEDDEDGDDEDGDDEDGAQKSARPQPREFLVRTAARLSIGSLPATLADLQTGMSVPLELGKDGQHVHGINAEAAEGTIVEGRIVELNAGTKTLKLMVEADDQEAEQSFVIANASSITLDGNKGSLADLKPGCGVTLRLNASKASVQAIAAHSPEADDE